MTIRRRNDSFKTDMSHGKGPLFSILMLLAMSPKAWTQDKPPDTAYPTRDDPHPIAAPPPFKKYKVYIWQETGDTLWRIAQKVYGDKDKWPLIYEANRDVLKDPHKIYPKQVLKIPPIDWQP